MGTHEPYWQTNTSFSPPPSRWDFRFPSEELPYDSHDDSLLYGSSTSSNSKGSRWIRGNNLYNHHHSAWDGPGLFLSSPSDLSQGPQWIPPTIQEIRIDDYENATGRGNKNDNSFHSLPSFYVIIEYFSCCILLDNIVA